jgi:hypothetical protein
MCGLSSAELESQSGSERVEAQSDQTPEFRLFDSACFPDYPSSDVSQAPLIQVMHRMDHHLKVLVGRCRYNWRRIVASSFLAVNGWPELG